MTDKQRAELRVGLERVIRVAEVSGAVATRILWPDYSGRYGAEVTAGREAAEPPPLSPWRQLFLSALVGEPIPSVVLLSALEDSGLYPNGVLEAAAEAEEAGVMDFGTPVYDPAERWQEGRTRFEQEIEGFVRSKQAEVYGLCKGVFGRGQAAVGNLFTAFLNRWFGFRPEYTNGPERTWLTSWPTTAYLRNRVERFPPLVRVFRHLRQTAATKTADMLDRLIAHLDRR